MSKNKTRSIARRVAVGCSAFLIAVILCVVLVLTQNTNKISNEIIQNQAINTMNGLNTNIQKLKEKSLKITTSFIEKRDIFSSINSNNFITLYTAFDQMFQVTDADAVFITDKEGKIICTSNDKIDFSTLECTATALTGTPVGTYQVIDNMVYVAYSAPIVSSGSIIGSATSLCLLSSDSFIDDIKETTGSEISIIVGDTRASTTIMKDGQRETGTKIDAKISKIVNQDKKDFIGEVKVSDVSYMVKYHPVLDENGNVLFTLFTANRTDEVKSQLKQIKILAIIIVVVSSLFGMLFLNFILGRIIKRPVKAILTVANNLEQGNIGISDPSAVVVDTKSKNELGLISSALGETAYSLQRYISEISTVLSGLSIGDLTVETSDCYSGDFISIKNALDNIINSLNKVMGNINEAAEMLAGRSDQISSSAMQLSLGSTKQASTVQELSATIIEISDQVNKNAEAANKASEISKLSSDEVSEGNNKMEEMLTSMNDINDASSEIEKIIKTIEDIAFQTNILALNAAVEAARAGAAGKGFAVVADEVRNLASKSAEAAKQTTTLIQNTINLVENGTKIANSTADTFKSIISSTQQSTKLIEHISEATNAQAIAISQVTEGMQQISEVVQTTSATAEESAATSEELASQAQILKNLVSMFKIK